MATLDQDDLDAIEALLVNNNRLIPDSVWDEGLTGAKHNDPTSAGRRLRQLSDTVILKSGDTVAADNSGTINGQNSLGTITLQGDIGTVCVGQAIRVADQVRYIEYYNDVTNVAIVDSSWCTIPSPGDEYIIFNLRTPLIQKITSAVSGSIANVLSTLWGLFENVSGYRFTEKALEQAPTSAISGSGSFTIDLVIKLDNTNTVGDCDVSVTTSSTSSTTNLIASGRTDANGNVSFQLDEGTYYVWRQKLGVNFDNPATLTVDSSGNAVIS